MNEIARIEHWLKATLAGDSAIAAVVGKRVYAYQAPKGASFPFIIYSYQSGADLQGNGAERIQLKAIYQVKVICENEITDAVRAVADRIDELIGKAVRASDLGYQFSARRQSPISYLENAAPNNFRHLGGLYNIKAYPAT